MASIIWFDNINRKQNEQLDIVEKAKNLFKSVCITVSSRNTTKLKKKKTFSISKKNGLSVKEIPDLISKKRPTETSVDECITADAGTGASIESWSHVNEKNWADFTKADSVSK